MNEMPDAEHVARVSREIRDATPTVEEFAEHVKVVARAYGVPASHYLGEEDE